MELGAHSCSTILWFLMRPVGTYIMSHGKLGPVHTGAKLHSPAKKAKSFKLLQVYTGLFTNRRSQEVWTWEFHLFTREHNAFQFCCKVILKHIWQKHANKMRISHFLNKNKSSARSVCVCLGFGGWERTVLFSNWHCKCWNVYNERQCLEALLY